MSKEAIGKLGGDLPGWGGGRRRPGIVAVTAAVPTKKGDSRGITPPPPLPPSYTLPNKGNVHQNATQGQQRRPRRWPLALRSKGADAPGVVPGLWDGDQCVVAFQAWQQG